MDDYTKVKVALLIPDCHIPWHDKKAYNIMLEAALHMQTTVGINEIVILGDYLDFFGVTMHERNELPEFDFNQEIHEGIQCLKQLRDLFPTVKITYIEGNHEYRLKRYLWRNAKDLYGMIDVPTLLCLKDYDIGWVPYGKYQKYRIFNTNLWARHEPFAGGEHCASGTIKKGRGVSWVFGHTHRVQYAQINDIELQPIEAFSLGWLGQNGSPVVNFIKNHEQWMHAFGWCIAYENGNFNFETVSIKNYECISNGVYFSDKEVRKQNYPPPLPECLRT